MKMFLKIFGCALIFGTFNNSQASTKASNQYVNQVIVNNDDVDSSIFTENNNRNNEYIKKARRYLNLAQDDFTAVKKLSQRMSNLSDDNIRKSKSQVFEAIDNLREIFDEVNTIKQTNELMHVRMLLWVFSKLNDGLNLLCKDENKISQYTSQIKIINDIIQLCYRINNNLWEYKFILERNQQQ